MTPAQYAAHKVGLIHRDIKPSNILLDDDDLAYLIDFGIARVTDETRMTKTGNTIGTFAYIAPERLDPQTEEDARADIYSLACVLYEALTGKPPFAGSTTAHLIAAHLNTPPPRPSTTQPDVPPQVDEVIARGMAKNPDQRYATTVELATAAREAITTPLEQPAPAATLLSPTQQAGNRVPAQPMTVKAESPQPAAPTPTRPGAVSRRTTIALVAGAIALVAVIVAVVGISAVGKNPPSKSSPSSSGRPYAAQVVLAFSGLNLPLGVAVDTAGSLYVTDSGNHRMLKLAAGASTQSVLPFSDLDYPGGVAVDSAGNLYVTDKGNGRMLKLATGASTQSVLPFSDLLGPEGLAVDSAGNLYVTDRGNNRVLKLATGASTQSVLPFTGLDYPGGGGGYRGQPLRHRPGQQPSA